MCLSVGFMLLPLLAVLVLPLVLVVLIVRRLLKSQDSVRLSAEEQAQLQRLWDTLQRMEQRIENLETILLQRENPAEREPRNK